MLVEELEGAKNLFASVIAIKQVISFNLGSVW